MGEVRTMGEVRKIPLPRVGGCYFRMTVIMRNILPLRFLALFAGLSLLAGSLPAQQAQPKQQPKQQPQQPKQQQGKQQPKGPPRAPDMGIEIPATVKATLGPKVVALGKEIDTLKTELQSKPAMLELLPDVQIYYNAAYHALMHNIFYNTNEFKTAEAMVNFGHYRAKQLRDGNPGWIHATGLVVRGYVSRIDGSVQPYGLEVPATYSPNYKEKKHRLDYWFHGRDSKLSELKFINERQKNYGRFKLDDGFVLQPYGRHNNGSRFAGETDAFEALEAVKKHYPIDDNRISVRGFSLGGATTWHLATHHAGKWFAAAPGAGFSDTEQFLKIYSNRDPKPTWFEEKLWRMYDSVTIPGNLFQCPTIAYSGENDGQKLAADLMEAAMAKEGLKLKHVIGKGMGHNYDTNSMEEINKWMDAQAVKGREVTPKEIRFTLFTLAFNEMKWITVDALQQHWEKAQVNATVTGAGAVQVKTENIVAFTINMPAGQALVSGSPKVTVDGKELAGTAVAGDKSWKVPFYKLNGQWYAGVKPEAGLVKKHGLQGPIDHAFMDSFIFVIPTGRSQNFKFSQWQQAELADAVNQWWLQMRGQVRIKKDTELTDDDIAKNHLVIWGDAQSNKVLADMADKLPITWTAKEVKIGSKTFSAETQVPVLIYPNPLNPTKYVVLNSSFTFAYAGMANNCNQYPRLPDWAVLDMATAKEKRHPGGVTYAGFFDEQWKLVERPE
ncbi:MAG: hypothetical protein K0Q55_3984 [Verrucomicrobia bacterium]|nr:hypothetical protein [Verrucomicrobiota bacterium]